MSVLGCVYVEREMEELQELMDEMESNGLDSKKQLELLAKHIEKTRRAASTGYL